MVVFWNAVQAIYMMLCCLKVSRVLVARPQDPEFQVEKARWANQEFLAQQVQLISISVFVIKRNILILFHMPVIVLTIHIYT